MALAELICAVTAFSIIEFIWIFATLHTIYHLYRSSALKNGKSVSEWVRNTSLIYLVSYTIAYFVVLLLTGLTLNYHTFFYDHSQGWDIMISIIGVFGVAGFLSFYLFIIGRLYSTFKGTQYGISERTRNVYTALAIIVCILLVFYLSSYYLYQRLLPFALPVAATAIVLNLGIAISLTVQFTQNLTKCASFRRESFSDLQRTDTLSERQEGLLMIAARQCAMSCVGMAMFNLFIPGTISIYVWVYPHTIRTYLLTLAACSALHTIEMISVLFTFAFNKEYYYKFCKPCDRGCNMLLHGVAVRRLNSMDMSVPATALQIPHRVKSASSATTQSSSPSV